MHRGPALATPSTHHFCERMPGHPCHLGPTAQHNLKPEHLLWPLPLFWPQRNSFVVSCRILETEEGCSQGLGKLGPCVCRFRGIRCFGVCGGFKQWKHLGRRKCNETNGFVKYYLSSSTIKHHVPTVLSVHFSCFSLCSRGITLCCATAT